MRTETKGPKEMARETAATLRQAAADSAAAAARAALAGGDSAEALRWLDAVSKATNLAVNLERGDGTT
jgi:hypothetical protein